MCTICHSAESSNLVQIHHIDGNHDNDDLDNLTLLCIIHHKKAQDDLQLSNSMTRKFTSERLKYWRDEWFRIRESKVTVTTEKPNVGMDVITLPDSPSELDISVQLSPDVSNLLHDFLNKFELVKQVTQPRTKTRRIQELERSLNNLCHTSVQWDEQVREAIRSLIDYIMVEFSDLTFISVYLEVLLDIVIYKKNEQIANTILRTFEVPAQNIWSDTKLDDKSVEPIIITNLVALLLYANEFQLKYITKMIHAAITQSNEFDQGTRFWPVLSAIVRYGLPELRRREGTIYEICSFISMEQDKTEGKDEPHGRALAFEQAFRQSSFWV